MFSQRSHGKGTDDGSGRALSTTKARNGDSLSTGGTCKKVPIHLDVIRDPTTTATRTTSQRSHYPRPRTTGRPAWSANAMSADWQDVDKRSNGVDAFPPLVVSSKRPSPRPPVLAKKYDVWIGDMGRDIYHPTPGMASAGGGSSSTGDQGSSTKQAPLSESFQQQKGLTEELRGGRRRQVSGRAAARFRLSVRFRFPRGWF
jgi:hypothetical protein